MGYTKEQQKEYLKIFNKRKYEENKYNNDNCEKRLSTKLNTFLNELVDCKECNEEITEKHKLDILIEQLRVIQTNLPNIVKKPIVEENQEQILLEEPKDYIIKPRERTEAQKKGWEKAQQVRDMNRANRAKEKEEYMKELNQYKEQIQEEWKEKLLNKAISLKKQQIINEALDNIQDCNLSYDEVCKIKSNSKKKEEPLQLRFI